jgi:hypothetical protein
MKKIKMALSVVFFYSLVFFPFQTTHAAEGEKTLIGGRVLYTEVCTCMPDFYLVFVGPPNGGAFMYGPETQLKMNYNFWEPAWQLGYAMGDGISCLVYVEEECVEMGSGPAVVTVGTSAE